MKGCINTVKRQKVPVSFALDEASAFGCENRVRLVDGAQPMRDNKRRSPAD